MATEALIGLCVIAAFMGALAYFGTRPDSKERGNHEKEAS